jgi:hypothetical protein
MLPALEILIMLRRSNRQTELRFFLVLALQRGERDPQEPHRLGKRHLVLQQRDRQAFEVAAARNRNGYGPAAGDDLEVVELHLQGHGPAPRAFSSQCRQTLSISGCSSAAIASNSMRSLENVFSAPTDFRIRFAWTSRLSTPLDIQ